MDYISRGGERSNAPASAASAPSHHTNVQKPRRKHIDWATRTVRLELFILLVGTALLLAATSLYLGFNANASSSEFDRVNKDKYQAVFLNGGVTSGSVLYSTYFGHITKMNDKYAVLNGVYYLTTNDQGSQSSQANPQLTKLGCQQLHSPYDEMVISRVQMAFWENLKDDGKVVQAIKAYQKQNPNGPDCSQSTSGTQNSATSTQNPSSTNKP